MSLEGPIERLGITMEGPRGSLKGTSGLLGGLGGGGFYGQASERVLSELI